MGVVRVDGDFEKDDIVRIVGPDGHPFAVGRISCDSNEARTRIGEQGGKPLVHYNYLCVESLD